MGAPESAIIRQIDHILLKTDDVRRLFAILTDAVGLPVAWPIFPYRGFLSGAVSIGGINLELLQPVDPALPAAVQGPGECLIGVAFEPPAIDTAVEQLAARRIPHSPPAPFRFAGPGGEVSWTTVDLDGWSDCPILLLVKYNRDQDQRRAGLAEGLRARAGGPLGILSMVEILVGAHDLAAATGRWQQLLDPLIAQPSGHWQPVAGPAIRLVADHENRLRALLIGVRSLGTAIESLERLGLRGERGDDWIALDLPCGRAGPVRLVEQHE